MKPKDSFYRSDVCRTANRNTGSSESRCALRLQCIVIVHARLMN